MSPCSLNLAVLLTEARLLLKFQFKLDLSFSKSLITISLLVKLAYSMGNVWPKITPNINDMALKFDTS